MSDGKPVKVALYARLSKADGDSVSIKSQLETCRRYAAERGWEVVGEFDDDGVSIFERQPRERPALMRMMESRLRFDRILALTADRLNRGGPSDVMEIEVMAQERGSTVTTTDQTWETRTAEGEFMTFLHSMVNRLEVRKTSERIKRSHAYMRAAGRATRGAPYGWMTTRNPNGPGRVYTRDPERIGWVRRAAEKVRQGWTVYAVQQWLNEQGTPRPLRRDKDGQEFTPPGHRHWNYLTVERLLRHPFMAGLIPNNPNNKSKERGDNYLLDGNGELVVNTDVKIMSVREWRALVQLLDNKDAPQARPKALNATTSPLLSGMVYCAHCERRMYRGTNSGREVYYCPNKGCYQTISHLTEYVVERYLERTGGVAEFAAYVEVEESADDDLLASLEFRLTRLSEEFALERDRDKRAKMMENLAKLQEKRDALLDQPTVVRREPVMIDPDAPENYADARDDNERRTAFLDMAIQRVVISRGQRGGRGIDPKRVRIEWRHPDYDELPPEERADLALTAEQIGTEQAAERPEG